MSVGSSVFEPELDGQIITTVIGCTEKQQGEHGSVSRTVPLPAQIDLVAGLAVSWGRLQVSRHQKKRLRFYCTICLRAETCSGVRMGWMRRRVPVA